MKAYKILYVAMVAATVTAAAYSQKNYFSDVVAIQTANLATAEKRYAACLQSENGGVVESALAHVAMLKLMYPVKTFATVAREVKNVEEKNASAEIRYKAYIVSKLLDNPKLFASEARTSYESPDQLFGALTNRIHDTLVSNMTK